MSGEISPPPPPARAINSKSASQLTRTERTKQALIGSIDNRINLDIRDIPLANSLLRTALEDRVNLTPGHLQKRDAIEVGSFVRVLRRCSGRGTEDRRLVKLGESWDVLQANRHLLFLAR